MAGVNGISSFGRAKARGSGSCVTANSNRIWYNRVKTLGYSRASLRDYSPASEREKIPFPAMSMVVFVGFVHRSAAVTHPQTKA